MESLDSFTTRPPQVNKKLLCQLALTNWFPYSDAMNTDTKFTVFDGLIWGGSAISILGLIGLIWCVVTVWKARSAKLQDEEMRAVMQKVLPRNLGALFLSVIGLMLVIIGIILS